MGDLVEPAQFQRSVPTDLVDPDVVTISRERWEDMKILAYSVHQHSGLLLAMMHEDENA